MCCRPTSGVFTVQVRRADRGWVDPARQMAVLFSEYHLKSFWEHSPWVHSPGTTHLCHQPRALERRDWPPETREGDQSGRSLDSPEFLVFRRGSGWRS